MHSANLYQLAARTVQIPTKFGEVGWHLSALELCASAPGHSIITDCTPCISDAAAHNRIEPAHDDDDDVDRPTDRRRHSTSPPTRHGQRRRDAREIRHQGAPLPQQWQDHLPPPPRPRPHLGALPSLLCLPLLRDGQLRTEARHGDPRPRETVRPLPSPSHQPNPADNPPPWPTDSTSKATPSSSSCSTCS